jgi:phospholipid/cholesterol/gamma-HCH transport system ATP-binding protein
MDIEVKGLYKSFGKLEVLRGVDLKINSGGVHIILGGSGTGKSVLLKHMIGLLRPDAGDVLLDGESIIGKSERQLYPIRRRMGYIFQGSALLNSISVGRNVGLALLERGKNSRSEIQQIVEEKLAMVGLEGRAEQMPGTLSGGQKKRVGIARALATNPEVLFYDEPTAGLDPPTAASIDRVIVDVAQQTGTTSIVVTHDMVSVFEIAEQVHMLHGGKRIFTGTRSELLKSQDPHIHDFLERDCGAARHEMGSGEFESAFRPVRST